MPAEASGDLPTSPFSASRRAADAQVERFEVGDRVTHDRHGLGRVTYVDGDAGVVVDFGGHTEHVRLPARMLHRL